jgi:hypothetical protein
VPRGFKGKAACALANQISEFESGQRSKVYREILSLIGSEQLSDRDEGKVLSALAKQLPCLPDRSYLRNFEDFLALRGHLPTASQAETLSSLAKEISRRSGYATQIATALLNAGLEVHDQKALLDAVGEQLKEVDSDIKYELVQILVAALFAWYGGGGRASLD